MKVEVVLARLQGLRQNGKGWKALCPAHADKDPSLSINERDGKILVHCHAGCSQEAVLAALRIEARDLILDAGESGRRIVAEYPYTDENGSLLYQVVRYDPKDFRHRRPDGSGGWIWNLNGTRRVLYRLPEVLAAKDVFIVEGEKDVETARKMDFISTTGGAAGKWREEYSESLRGKRVAIIADADEPGRRHAQQVAESLHLRAESVKVLELPGAKDLSEWVERGGTGEALSELIRNAPEYDPTQRPPENAGRIALVTGEEFLRRSSGDEKPWLAEGLLPAASQAIWQGRPKVGKSHSLLQLVFDLASGLPAFGHFAVKRAVRCAFLKLEEPEAITKARCAAMLRAHGGQGPDAANLRFFTREDLHRMRVLPRELLGGRLKDFISAFRDAGSEFVVLIALRRFLLAGENLKDPEVAERVNDALDAILTETGAAIALANHTRKQGADTVEAQGFGSTFIAARADATFEIERARDGGRRRVRSEARFDAPEQFFIQKETAGEGELIRWCEAAADPKQAKPEELSRRVADGETVHRAAEALGIPYATAKRWARDREEAA